MLQQRMRRFIQRAVLAMVIPVAVGAEGHSPIPAESWPNWRGPECSGYAPCDQPLVKDLMEATLAWHSEQTIPSGLGKENYGSGFNDVIIADNKAFYSWWTPAGPADERVERALTWTGEMRRKKGKKFKSYILGAADHVQERSRPLADDTIVAWDAANGETLWTATMAGKGFNTGHITISYSIYSPHLVSCYYDGTLVSFSSSGRIHALRAADGKPLWEGQVGRVADRVVMLLADFARNGAYFAGGGSRFWQPRPNEPTQGLGMKSSGIIADGVIAIADFEGDGKSCGMIGIDLRTGERLWQIPNALNVQASVPLRWRHQDKEYLLAINLDRGICVEPRSGKILWEIKGDPLCAETQPAVYGDHLITPGRGSYGRGKGAGKNMTCWKISPEGAKQVWEADEQAKMGTFSGPVITGGKVYFKSGSGVACRDLATGTLLGTSKGRSSNAALVMTGDRLFIANEMFIAADDGISPAGNLAEAGRRHNLGFDTERSDWTSATVCDGRLYYRTDERVLCWDVHQTPRSVRPRASAPSIADAAAALTALEAREEVVRKAGRAWLLAHKEAARQVVDQLGTAAISDAWQRASAAAEILIDLGSEAKAVVPTVMTATTKALADGDAATARLLTQVVVTLDPTRREALAAAAAAQVNDTDLLKVQAACAVLRFCGEAAEVALPQITTLLRHGDRRSMEFAIEAFSSFGSAGKGCASVLIDSIAADPTGDRALLAARCLDALNPGAVGIHEPLMTAFCQASGPTRFWLSEVLTEIGPAMIEPFLAVAKREFEAGKSSDHTLLLDVGKTCMNLGTEARAALPWLEAMKQHLSTKDDTLATEQQYMEYCCDVIAGRPVTLMSRNGKHREGIPMGDAAQCEAYFKAKAAGEFDGKYSPKTFAPPSKD